MKQAELFPTLRGLKNDDSVRTSQGGKSGSKTKQAISKPKIPLKEGGVDYRRISRSLSEVAAVFERAFTTERIAAAGDIVSYRLVSQLSNSFYFWKDVSNQPTSTIPALHPGLSVQCLGAIDGATNEFRSAGGKCAVVKAVSGLSRAKSGGEKDPWAATVQDNFYVRGAAVTITLDAERMLRQEGLDELVQFLEAALMLEQAEGVKAEYVALSGIFDSVC